MKLKVKVTPAIEELIKAAAADMELPEDVRLQSQEYMDEPSIEWDALKIIAEAVKRRHGDNGLFMHQLCAGGGLVLSPPLKPQCGKSPELQAHLDNLRTKLEQQQYDAMLGDVLKEEKAAEARQEGGLRTYMQQMSFGVHVLVMMGSFYAFGHIAGMALTTNKALHPIFGLALMVSAMLLETVLFVVRMNMPPPLPSLSRSAAAAGGPASQGAPGSATARQQQLKLPADKKNE